MLNAQQTAAVHYTTGPLLVLAGAGSGKTRVITHKIAHLIQHCGHLARQIYAVTFTNKAANEMRARAGALLPAEKRRGLHIGTFHALGLSFLKEEAHACGLLSRFSILDAEDAQFILRDLLPKSASRDREYVFQAQQKISLWKNELITPLHACAMEPSDEPFIAIYQRYQDCLQAYNAVDFDDLLRLPVLCLQTNAEIRERWQNKIRHLLIDEYQDSNLCQYQLVKLLTGVLARFTAVGDDAQSIYAWRGAKPENLAQLQVDYPHIHVMKLEQNYRSTNMILNAANHLIANNQHLFSKNLWSQRGAGEPIRVLHYQDEIHEADGVVLDIISHRLHQGTRYQDYAILYRSNHQSRHFEKILRHHGIRYHVSGGQSWFARKEIKDVFAYLKLLTNPLDDAAFLRCITTPARGVGEITLKHLTTYAATQGKSLYLCADHLALQTSIGDKPYHALSRFKTWIDSIQQRLQLQPINEVLQALIHESGLVNDLEAQYESLHKVKKCLENMEDLIAWIARLQEKNSDHTLLDIINKLILIDRLEQSDNAPDEDTLQLMTLHAAKGLEFPYVYLVGVEENILPHRNNTEPPALEEERRLMYVGITRAGNALSMTIANQRRQGGQLEVTKPSRFLDEIPADYLDWRNKPGTIAPTRTPIAAQKHLQGLKALLSNEIS